MYNLKCYQLPGHIGSYSFQIPLNNHFKSNLYCKNIWLIFENIIYSHLLTPDYYVILIIPLLFPGLQCPGFHALHGSLALVSELFANNTYRYRFKICQVSHLEAEVNRKLLWWWTIKNKLQREEKKKTPHDHVHSEYLAHLKLDTLQKHDYKDRFYTYLSQILGYVKKYKNG